MGQQAARPRELGARAMARHAAPSVIDGTIIPLVVFTVLVHTWGLRPALWGSLLWAYSALVRRAIRGQRIPGILVIGTVGVTLRLLTMVVTGSAWLFFFQPVVATLGTAGAFAVSAIVDRPLAARLGADVVPLAEETWAEPLVARTCRRLSWLWAAALCANAGMTLWMLTTFTVPTFVLLRPVVSLTTTLPAIVASAVAGRAVLLRSNLHRRPEREPAASPPRPSTVLQARRAVSISPVYA